MFGRGLTHPWMMTWKIDIGQCSFRPLFKSRLLALATAGLLAIFILRGTMVYEGGTKFALRERPGEKAAQVDINEMRGLLSEELYKNHAKFYMVSLETRKHEWSFTTVCEKLGVDFAF